MNEWERSLTPSPGLSPVIADKDAKSDYLGRAVSPAGSFKEVKAD
jgi:hypothetical protein